MSTEVEKQKILFIDGLSTIMNEKYFILDEIPRIIAEYLEEGFKIMIVLREREDSSRWYDFKVVPDWMRNNITVSSEIDYTNLMNIVDKETSMVISNDISNPVLQDVFDNINDIKDVFNFGKYPVVNRADYLFCFGFDEKEFMDFCNQSNLIGIIGEHVARDNDFQNSINGMAFLVDKDKSWSENLKDMKGYIKACLKENRYIPRHSNRMLGIIFQGREYAIAKASQLNLLYV
jgi:hypothetical protein